MNEDRDERSAQRTPLYRNLISHLGLLVMTGSAVLILFAMLSQLTVRQPSPYVGIFTYLIFPGIFGVGLLLVLYGMRWEARRRRRTQALQSLPYPQLDLNDPRQRKLFGYVLVGGSVLGTILTWAIYNGYLYTESVAFCGTVCHTVMKPEHTAYSYSAHARVPCVSCHVGEGAGWYARSKIDGVRQVFAVAFHTYSRPISAPIKHLRPARETCEHCHWPEKFFGATLLQLPHFRYDEQATPEQISLTVKTGGGSKTHGASAGIHWHMVIDNTITFVARDQKQLDIPWVRVKHDDGSTVEYFARPLAKSRADVAGRRPHAMDCIDCHNRPTHASPTPDGSVDEALFRGLIPKTLPWIKKLGVDALMAPYAGEQAAHEGIARAVRGFYRSKYPVLAEQRRADIDTASRALVGIYDRAVFPDMNVTWGTYPSHIGHRYWPGCFRCHDGRHVSSDGKVLSHRCDGTCHTMPRRGPITALGVPGRTSAQHWHPWELEAGVDIAAHERVLCHQCHQAGRGPLQSCAACHQ